MDPKAALQARANQIREAAQLGDPIALCAVAMVQAAIDDNKQRLVMADGDDMLRTQGAVRQLQSMYRELTRTPPGTGAKE